MNILPYINYVTGQSDGVIITLVDIMARINELKEHEKLIAEREILPDTISYDVNDALTKVVLAVGLLATMPAEGQQGAASRLAMADSSVLEIKHIII